MPVSLYCLCMLEVPSREQEQCPTLVVSSPSPGLQPPASSYNPYGGSIGDNISETATDYCLSYV